jgi:hypothetical protein
MDMRFGSSRESQGNKHGGGERIKAPSDQDQNQDRASPGRAKREIGLGFLQEVIKWTRTHTKGRRTLHRTTEREGCHHDALYWLSYRASHLRWAERGDYRLGKDVCLSVSFLAVRTGKHGSEYHRRDSK